MKIYLLLVLIILANSLSVSAQITTPVIRARFGVDGDLRANYINGAVQTGNDDWFNLNAADTSGKAVIDTTGAAAILAGYLSDAAPWPKRMASFYRTMSRPPFSVVNNRLWLDALFVRDYHGNDTTVYVSGSDKNGMSPANWTGGVQSIPDKNDILDMFVHVRRAGPNTTDSLWMFGGISLDNITGNRYFDFEMYQTDIYYDRASAKFYGYGSDAGHTSWQFDATGKIIRPGDIIFSGEFQSGTLTKIEARIWVKKTDWQTVTPTAFNWSGQFDGDGSGATYGYASISPNTLGAFYTGLGSPNNSWAGPFGLVLQNNTLAYLNPGPASRTNSKYLVDQFIEFSVNLTKLGLDPVTLLGGDVCGTPFNRIIVKTRASASFTAELKDFVAPTDLFLAPRALALSEAPALCNEGGITEIYVDNPISTSVYQWSTSDGNIITSPATGPSIYVDKPGTYIVTQYLQAGCSVYATDTVVILLIENCQILDKNFSEFHGELDNDQVKLDWKVLNNLQVKYFEVERSEDGINFTTLDKVKKQFLQSAEAIYLHTDNVSNLYSRFVYYRIKLVNVNSIINYSHIINIHRVSYKEETKVNIAPNPVRDIMQLQVLTASGSDIRFELFDQSGKLVSCRKIERKGRTTITLDDLAGKPRGMYIALVYVDDKIFRQKLLVAR
jgi:hypothetical protein